MGKERGLEKSIKVSENEITEILEGYIPEVQYLKSAEINYPTIIGKFQIQKTFYFDTKGKPGHFTAVEMVMCLNQLGFVYVNEMLKNDLIKGMPPLNKENYKNWAVNGFLLTGFDDVKFRKTFDASKEFDGKATIERVMHRNLLHFIYYNYDFDNGKVVGKLNTALIFKNGTNI